MRFIKRYRQAIFGALFGVFVWWMLPHVLEALRTIGNLESILNKISDKHGFLLAVILAALFAEFFELPKQLRRLVTGIRRRIAGREPIEVLFEDEAEIHLIMPHMRQQEFARFDSDQRIALPSNAPFLPATHGVAIGRFEARVSALFAGRKRVKISYDESPPADLAEHSFLVLGGPLVNRTGYQLIQYYSETLLSDFEITADLRAVDQTTTFRPVIKSDKSLSRDYGFVIIVPSHLNPSKRICYLFGLWPQGTLAAMNALIRPERCGPLAKSFRELVNNGSHVLAVIRVEITGLIEGNGVFEKVRPLER